MKSSIRQILALTLAVGLTAFVTERASAQPPPAYSDPSVPAPDEVPVPDELVPDDGAAFNPFLPPDGLTETPETLHCVAGFSNTGCFVYSPSNDFKLAYQLYLHGYFQDVIALMDHAIAQDPTADFFYLRGLAQMRAGLCQDALRSAQGLLAAEAAGRDAGLVVLMERLNGPTAVQFRELLSLPVAEPADSPDVRERPDLPPGFGVENRDPDDLEGAPSL